MRRLICYPHPQDIGENNRNPLQMKPELYLLAFMEEELNKNHSILLFYIIATARLYMQKWKSKVAPHVENWIFNHFKSDGKNDMPSQRNFQKFLIKIGVCVWIILQK